MGLRDLGALDQAQLDSPEWAAARHVLAVVGGTAEINDTNAEDGQFDVLIVSEDGRSIALEATSFGGDQWKQTHSRIRKQTHEGVLDGNDLRWQWGVVVPTGSDIRRVSRSVEALLRDAEAVGVDSLSQRYRGDDEALAALAARLIKEGIEEAWVWEKAPPKGQPRVLLHQSRQDIGTAGSLPSAIATLFETKPDNQEKLRRATCDEHHLYVFLEDGGAAAVLEGLWPLPACPPDPADVLDCLWLYTPSLSGYLFRVRPGTEDWCRFLASTGEAAPPA